MRGYCIWCGKIARGFIGQLLDLSKGISRMWISDQQQLVDRLNKGSKLPCVYSGEILHWIVMLQDFQAVQLMIKRIGAAPCGSLYRLCFRRWCKPEVALV